MTRSMLHFLVVIAVALGSGAACHPGTGPEVRVLGRRQQVVFVQVSNPASRPMRLTKLDYQFLADNRTISTGELPLDQREIPAGEAIVVEVPLDGELTRPMTLTGTLTAELDQIVRNFAVQAQITPH
jgi:hypothetical protein